MKYDKMLFLTSLEEKMPTVDDFGLTNQIKGLKFGLTDQMFINI